MCRIINDKCIFLGVDAQCILEPDFLPVPQMSSSFAYIGGANDIDAKNTQKYNEILYIKLQIVDLQQNVTLCMAHTAFHLQSLQKLWLLFIISTTLEKGKRVQRKYTTTNRPPVGASEASRKE